MCRGGNEACAGRMRREEAVEPSRTSFRKGTITRRALRATWAHAFSMRLSEEAIQEFASLYKEEFGEELTKAEASEMAYRLMVLYEQLSKPLPDEQGAAPVT